MGQVGIFRYESNELFHQADAENYYASTSTLGHFEQFDKVSEPDLQSMMKNQTIP